MAINFLLFLAAIPLNSITININSKHRNTLSAIFSHPTPGSLEWRRIEDPIVAEIHRHRKEHAAEHGNNLKRIVNALRKRERESKAQLIESRTKIAHGQDLKLIAALTGAAIIG